jgi:hypothetical protein
MKLVKLTDILLCSEGIPLKGPIQCQVRQQLSLHNRSRLTIFQTLALYLVVVQSEMLTLTLTSSSELELLCYITFNLNVLHV